MGHHLGHGDGCESAQRQKDCDADVGSDPSWSHGCGESDNRKEKQNRGNGSPPPDPECERLRSQQVGWPYLAVGGDSPTQVWPITDPPPEPRA